MLTVSFFSPEQLVPSTSREASYSVRTRLGRQPEVEVRIPGAPKDLERSVCGMRKVYRTGTVEVRIPGAPKDLERSVCGMRKVYRTGRVKVRTPGAPKDLNFSGN